MATKLIKRAHSTIRLEKDSQVLVIDPGVFAETDATAGAEAILITHEHQDHFDEERVRAVLEATPAVEVWTQGTVAELISATFPGRVHVVGDGDAFTVAGFDIRVYGEYHAEIHPDIPRGSNIGFLVDNAVFHPGDAFTVPDRPVHTLMIPIHAPWNKAAEVIDYIREVKPQRAVDIHDEFLAAAARPLYDNLIGNLSGIEHVRLDSGGSLDIQA
jgi:L-ascorbate metabolism protein UlaG (beta-lactamase superfamily)